jgi:large subunit ribosomal protein L22
MQTSAKAKYIRISPKKIRLVVDVVRGMKTEKAIEALKFMNKRSAKPVMKLINSAIANAEHNFELDKDNLFIKEIRVDEAPTLKRWMPRAHGRATTIRKRNSHINLILSEIKDSGEKEGRKQEADAPVKLGDMGKKEKEEAKKEIKQEKKGEAKKEKADIFDEDNKNKSQEVMKEINDPRREGRGGHARAEGGKRGFSSKIFRRKSG